MSGIEAASTFLGSPPAARQAGMLAELQRWVAQRWLRALDQAFAAFLARRAPDADPLLLLAAALASHQLGRGHACLDLQATLADADTALALPPPGSRETAAVAVDGDAAAAATPPARLLAGLSMARWQRVLHHPLLVGTGAGDTPLVLVGTRLYLRRYWDHEHSVRARILQRVATPTLAADPALQGALAEALAVLFPQQDGGPTDWQKIACALVGRQAFGVLTGGPGTGKTTTVVRLLAVLQHLACHPARGPAAQPLRIRLAAPTGKAAARLGASIGSAVAGLPLQGLAGAEGLRATIPTEVSTVHRLLGSRPGTRHFRHHAGHPLALDLLVLDEASMLDLEATASVLDALPPQAGLILLGDKDQLASVEAGAVLGDLCQRADGGHYRLATAQWVEALAGELLAPEFCDAGGTDLDQAIVKLRTSHRFGGNSGVGRLAEAVNRGDVAATRRVLARGSQDLALQSGDDPQALRRLVVDGAPEAFGGAGMKGSGPVGYAHYLRVLQAERPDLHDGPAAIDAWARSVLQAQARFQLLCATRQGPQGVEQLNVRIAALLRAEGLLEAPQAGWYRGRPVLVTRNDYGLGLMNGDVGVTLEVPVSDAAAAGGARWMPRVAFADDAAEGGIRWVLPSRLHAIETVFAMTVHTSQGSEFAHTALVLPAQGGALLTRELVYTGITRARGWCTLVAELPVLEAAVRRRVLRVGGLAEGWEG